MSKFEVEKTRINRRQTDLENRLETWSDSRIIEECRKLISYLDGSDPRCALAVFVCDVFDVKHSLTKKHKAAIIQFIYDAGGTAAANREARKKLGSNKIAPISKPSPGSMFVSYEEWMQIENGNNNSKLAYAGKSWTRKFEDYKPKKDSYRRNRG